MAEPKVQIVWASPEEKAVVLENATIVRPVSLPETWRAVKLGVRFIMSGSNIGNTANMTGTPRFYLGFCSGSNIVGDPTADFFIGYKSTSATWTYASSSTREYYTYAEGVGTVVLDGKITSSSDLMSSTNYVDRACGVFKPSVFELGLTRSLDESKSDYRLTFGYYTGTGVFAGFTKETFLGDMTAESAGGIVQISNAYNTPTVGFRSGFDNVLVAWDKETPNQSFAVLDIAVASFE
jgi:hypothetical protein